jgi:hypothetical protein
MRGASNEDFGPEKEDVTGVRRKLKTEKLNNL